MNLLALQILLEKNGDNYLLVHHLPLSIFKLLTSFLSQLLSSERHCKARQASIVKDKGNKQQKVLALYCSLFMCFLVFVALAKNIRLYRISD